MQPWGWLTGMIVAGISLFEAFLWMLEYPGSGIGLGMSIMPIITCVLSRGTPGCAASHPGGPEGSGHRPSHRLP
jgi:hypothetical protein